MTVKEYMQQNDNFHVRLDGKETFDTCDPLAWHLWEGMLQDVPEQLQTLEVVTDGWLIQAKTAVLEVFAPRILYPQFFHRSYTPSRGV